MSEGVPSLPSGVSSFRSSSASLERDVSMSVIMAPGATQLTVMFDGPSSLARALVKPMTADLADEYAASNAPQCPRLRRRL